MTKKSETLVIGDHKFLIAEVKRSEDVYVEIPEELGFKAGDEFALESREDGVVMTKIKYEQVELDIPEKVFTAVAMMAHRRKITLNELIVEIIKEMIEE